MANPERELLHTVMDRLGKIAEAKGLDHLALSERVLVLTMWATGIIQNGGFRYFFEDAYFHHGVSHVDKLAGALDYLGFPRAAEACRKAASFFPEGVLDEGPTASSAYMDRFSNEQLDAAFEDLNRAVWNVDDGDELEHRLAALIRKDGLDKKTGE